MPQAPRPDPPARSRIKAAVRALLLVPLSPEGARIIDIVILPIGAFVAFFVCIPIWILTILAGAAVGSVLAALGAPEGIRSVFTFLGIGGGIVLSFVALLRIYRRLPAGIRGWVTPDDDDTPDVESTRDPAADPFTVNQRVARLDASLTPSDAIEDLRTESLGR